jgi:hypothetical protein
MLLKKTLLSAGVALSLIGSTTNSAVAALAEPFPEYQNQWGLGAIGALAPWGAGVTGAGVTVAVIDSGIRSSHVDFAGRIAPGAIDIVNGDSDPQDDTTTSHGTHVAGIIAANRNDIGTVGVAYNAMILPIKVTDSTQHGRFGDIAAGINYAAASSARVINMSIVERADPVVEQALLHAAAADKVITMPAGNYGRGAPEYFAAYASELSGHAIIVGAINPDGSLASFSNQGGSWANYYMVAPGVSINAPTNKCDTCYGVLQDGTSWASPHVAGAAALLMSAFPNLTATQVVSILLSTATDLGEPGIDPVYGHGLLNVERAIAPAGELSSPTGSDSGGGGGSASLGVAALALGAAAGYALIQKQTPAEKTLVLDKYDRGYVVDLTKAMVVRDDVPDMSSLMQALANDTSVLNVPLPNNQKLTLLYATPDMGLVTARERVDLFNDSEPVSPSWTMSLHGGVGARSTYEVNLNTTPSQGLSLLDDGGLQQVGTSFLTEKPLTGSYLGFGSTADSAAFGYRMSDSTNLKLGLVSVDDGQDHGLRSNAATVKAGYRANERTQFSLHLGELDENGSLFGGSSGGPLSVDKARTTALGLSARFQLSRDVALLGDYSEGVTRVKDSRNSLIGNFSTLRTRSFGFGLVADSLFAANDRFGLAVSQPLRVTRGNATLDIPVGIDAAGHISREQDTISLAPPGTESDFEAYYKLALGKHSDLSTYFLYQSEPLNNPELSDQVTVYATYRMKF